MRRQNGRRLHVRRLRRLSPVGLRVRRGLRVRGLHWLQVRRRRWLQLDVRVRRRLLALLALLAPLGRRLHLLRRLVLKPGCCLQGRLWPLLVLLLPLRLLRLRRGSRTACRGKLVVAWGHGGGPCR